MRVPLLQPHAHAFQQENWLLDPTKYWTKEGRVDWNDLSVLAEADGTLWLNGHSTYNGKNDKIPLALAQSIRSSLKLVRVDGLTLSVFKPGEAFGNPKRRVQAQYQWQGVAYRHWVTDPNIERHYKAQPDGEHTLGESYLTISLGEPHNDACYKLVAAIIERTPKVLP